jgi:hypothetical protein
MRLLQINENGEFSLTDDLVGNIPPYAILSHTWAEDHEEVRLITRMGFTIVQGSRVYMEQRKRG